MSEIFNCELAYINDLFFNLPVEEEKQRSDSDVNSSENKLESPAVKKIKDEDDEDE